MTTFWRDGFWRTSVNGTTHWVEGHWVTREQGVSHSPEWFREILAGERALGSFTARLVIPNAICPVCGAEVFFYANSHGSRVYFDELGPPWPKHPCTVLPPTHVGAVTPAIRERRRIEQISLCIPFTGVSAISIPDASWVACRVVLLVKREDALYMVLVELANLEGPVHYLSVNNGNWLIEERGLVFLSDRMISVLDAELNVAKLDIQLYRDAQGFLDNSMLR